MRLARVWLTAAAAMACVRAGCSATATTATYGQLKNVIAELLANDKRYVSLLTERVRLPAASVPQSLRAEFADLDDVHPLYAVFTLNRDRDDHYSRTALDLSLLVLNTAITCRAYKRAAVQVALAVRLVQLENEKVRFKDVMGVLTDMFPYNVDLLLSDTEARYTDLLRLYRRIESGAWRPADRRAHADPDELGLANNLRTLTAAIRSSCKVGEMKDYFAEFGLLDDAARLPGVITDHDTIADDVPESDVSAMMTKNQQAIQKFHEEMKLFRKMSLTTWQNILKSSAAGDGDGDDDDGTGG